MTAIPCYINWYSNICQFYIDNIFFNNGNMNRLTFRSIFFIKNIKFKNFDIKNELNKVTFIKI